jgi:hypothetical protein
LYAENFNQEIASAVFIFLKQFLPTKNWAFAFPHLAKATKRFLLK